jgi:hypothetical protein
MQQIVAFPSFFLPNKGIFGQHKKSLLQIRNHDTNRFIKLKKTNGCDTIFGAVKKCMREKKGGLYAAQKII